MAIEARQFGGGRGAVLLGILAGFAGLIASAAVLDARVLPVLTSLPDSAAPRDIGDTCGSRRKPNSRSQITETADCAGVYLMFGATTAGKMHCRQVNGTTYVTSSQTSARKQGLRPVPGIGTQRIGRLMPTTVARCRGWHGAPRAAKARKDRPVGSRSLCRGAGREGGGSGHPMCSPARLPTARASEPSLSVELMSDGATSSYAGDGSSALAVCEVQARLVTGYDLFVRSGAGGTALGAAGGSAWVLMPLAFGGGLRTVEARFEGPWHAEALPGLSWQVSARMEGRNA